MLYGIKVVAQALLGIDIAGRSLAVYPDDTYLVSYPRSGNTWTRFLIANLLFPEGQVSFENIEKLIPDAEAQSNRTLRRTPRPRVIKTHEYFDHRYPKVLYIVRDPRDVALSYYDFHRKYHSGGREVSVTQFIDDFVNGRLSSADWGTWGENVASWVYPRSRSKNFLLLRYEDLVADTRIEIARIARFLNIDADPERLDRAIALSAVDRMREMEKRQETRWLATLGYSARRAQQGMMRKDIPFVGTAKSGGWKDKLPQECVYRIEEAWGDLMLKHGYELVAVRSRDIYADTGISDLHSCQSNPT